MPLIFGAVSTITGLMWNRAYLGLLKMVKGSDFGRTPGSLDSVVWVTILILILMSLIGKKSVAAYSNNSDWDWSVLHQLPPSVCQVIASIHPPSAGHDDYPFWVHSADWIFSIKSAYGVLAHDLENGSSDFPFDLIWKIRTPPRVNTFIWKVAHHNSHDKLGAS